MKTARLALLLLQAGALASCAGPRPLLPPPLPPTEQALYPRAIMTGDVLEVGFYRTNLLEARAYAIEVGDVLRIEVGDRPELTSERAAVLPDGTIALSLVGSIPAAGRTVRELERALAAAYRAKNIRDPQVVVAVQQANQRLEQFLSTVLHENAGTRLAFRVYDGQQIALPFLPAVEVAGRPLDDVREEVRDGYTRIFGRRLDVTVNLRERPDQIVYVMGEVQRPGPVPLAPGSNLLTVIASGGGLLDTADPEQVLVVRFAADGSYRYWTLNLREGAQARDEAGRLLPLQRNDIVFIGKSKVAEINTFIDQYIRRMLPFPVGVGASVNLLE